MGCQCAKQAPDNNEITKENKNPLVAQSKEEDQKDNLNINANSMVDTVKSGAIKTEDRSNERKPSQISNSEKANSIKEKLNFNMSVFELINEVRANPPAFADKIMDSIKNITQDKDKLIYKQKVKVSLSRGEPAFIEVAEKLRTMQPLAPFILKQDIVVPSPQDEEELKNKQYLGSKIKEIKLHDPVDASFKDMIKNAEVAVLLMIVDDNAQASGKKREAILSNQYVNIGISSTTIGKSFAAFYTFSK